MGPGFRDGGEEQEVSFLLTYTAPVRNQLAAVPDPEQQDCHEKSITDLDTILESPDTASAPRRAMSMNHR